MATLSVWDPSKPPGPSSLKNTPDATPESSLRGGSLYKKKGHVSLSETQRVIWTEFGNVADTKTKQLMEKDHTADQVDQRDKGTPDDWVPRHPALVRLTGRHPFNCEPPISMLYDQGFITPISLHYVRTHGKTPRLTWEDHRISITGLVKTPMSLSMDELSAKLPVVTLPVTLVCAGNRRKEENMVKQTIGFSWGCAALACNLWTGVRLKDLLEHCGIDRDRAQHVEFIGTSTEALPNGDGTYGTSIDIATAMDAYGDVLIAWEQNGARLSPDHGYPVRVVIPGWIGGRMVKWLEKIQVTDKPSDNHYHFFDNRILPPHVDAELAKAEGWWYKSDYLFNQLNINSAIVRPENGEVMTLTGAGMYTIRGYAYSGGGRKVTRVEISLDGGLKWHLCDCSYPEERMSHAPSNGKYWCWMFWEYTVDKFEFLNVASGSREIRCRAWDCASNTQPKDITWNLMGMGNNCHFTVKVAPKQSSGAFVLQFEHPTVPGPASGGWMTPPESVSGSRETRSVPTKSWSSPALAGSVKKYKMEEVEKHSAEDSAWIVVENHVYDATGYLKDHPGGATSIMLNAGMDATEEFLAIHSEKARRMLEDFYIGELITDETKDEEKPRLNLSKSSASLLISDLPGQELRTLDNINEASKDGLVALHPKKWIKFELIEKENISHDTRMFKFKLQSPDHRLGLPVGYHMFVKAKINDRIVMRAYTPVSSDKERGSFTLCVKIYFSGVHPKFPEGGKLSQYLDSLSIGDEIECKGPLGHFEYRGRGCYVLNGNEKFAKSIGLICGGTGLTPAYQVLSAVANDPADETEVYLLYANKSEDDILMRNKLDEMAEAHSNIHVWYTLDAPPEGWSYSSGFVNEQMLSEHIPKPNTSSIIGMCGPKPMIDFACIPNLNKLGFQASEYFPF